MKKNLSIFSASFYLLIIFFLFQGCGGGGDDSSGSTVTPPAENITGTYTLRAFTVKYSNGVTITDKDVSYSGTMKIGSQSISQSFVINNTPISVSGTYVITYTQGTSDGNFRVTDTTGTHDIPFSISGNLLATYSGVVTLGSGATFEEWDSWEKTSNSVESISDETIKDQNVESMFGAIGKIIIEKKIIVN